MKKKLCMIIGIWPVFFLAAAATIAQDTTPRGPAEWTGRNWLGFSLQILFFVLAVIGIYKLAGPEREEDSRKSQEESNRSDSSIDKS